MPTCGNCHQTNQTIAHVRECCGARYAPAKPAAAVLVAPPVKAPVVLNLDVIPAAKYVAKDATGTLVFIEVQRAEKGKWAGKTFVKQLIGAPGNWRKVPMYPWASSALLGQVAADPKAAALAYYTNFTVCSRCDAPLSDEVSRARGLGPDCVKHFAGV